MISVRNRRSGGFGELALLHAFAPLLSHQAKKNTGCNQDNLQADRHKRFAAMTMMWRRLRSWCGWFRFLVVLLELGDVYLWHRSVMLTLPCRGRRSVGRGYRKLHDLV